MSKQIFGNSAITYFFHKELIRKNPELQNRLVFTEDLSFESLIKKYRNFSNAKDKESLFNIKDPVLGYTRSVFKRFEGFSHRNTFKLNLDVSDMSGFDQDIRDYFLNNDPSGKTRIGITAAMVETEYKFLLVNSDIDIIDQYEQAYLNELFLTNVETFEIDGSEVGLGPSFNLPFSLIWNDLDEIAVVSEGMSYSGLSGSCRIFGSIIFSSDLPSYLIEKINLRLIEASRNQVLESIEISSS